MGRAVRRRRAAAGVVASVRPLRARLGARAPARAGRVRLATRRRDDRRAILALAAGLALGAAALLWLRHLYAPLQSKYGVGKGGAVVDLTSRPFWSDLASHVTGSSVPAFWFAVGAAVVLGVVSLAFRDRRAAIVAAVWLLLPLVMLQILTASSEDFAPERHLSFLLAGYSIALAGFLARARSPPRAAPDRRGGGARDAAHAAPHLGPERPLELQRRPPRREPRAGGRVRSPTTCS